MDDRELQQILDRKARDEASSALSWCGIGYVCLMGLFVYMLTLNKTINDETKGWIASVSLLVATGFGVWLWEKLLNRFSTHYGAKLCREFGHNFSYNPEKKFCIRCHQRFE